MFSKILFAVDGSSDSKKAAKTVAELAGALGSEVLVFHLREMLAVTGGPVDVNVNEDDADVASDIAAILVERGVTATSLRRREYYRRTPVEIVVQAHEFEADLIVMGSHGLSGLPGILLGSVTTKVLHLSDLPVLVV